MTDEKLLEAVQKQVQDVDGKRKLNCAGALALARQFGVSPTEIRRVCDEQDIRVNHCQLGCFE